MLTATLVVWFVGASVSFGADLYRRPDIDDLAVQTAVLSAFAWPIAVCGLVICYVLCWANSRKKPAGIP